MERDIGLIKAIRELVGSPPSKVDAALQRALSQTRSLLQGGRSWLMLPAAKSGFRVSHADAPDFVAALSNALSNEAGFLPKGIAARMAGRPLTVAEVAALPGGKALSAALEALSVRRCGFWPMTLLDGRKGILGCEMNGDSGDDPVILELLTEFAAMVGATLDRAQTERQRIETQARLEATMDALPDLLFEIDPEGRYTGFVAGPKEMFLHDRNTFVGREVGEVLPPDAARTAREAVRRVIDEGQASKISYALDLPDGRHVFEARGARRKPLPGESDSAALFIIRDVTAEHKMREELHQLGSVTQMMSNLVVIVDPDTKIRWVNAAFERHMGWTLNEIRGRKIAKLVRCEESDPIAAAGVAEAIAEAKPFSGQTINKDRYGNRFYVDFNIQPLHDMSGKLQGFVSVETVVTDLKHQQIALENLAHTAAAAQVRLENALNALPDSMMIFDADDRLIICNPAHAALFPGMSDVLRPGIPLRDLMVAAIERGFYEGPSDPAEMEDFIEGLLEPYHQASYADEFRIKDGRWFRRVNKRTSDGGLITAMIDITARQRQMAELDSANLRLWRALEERELAEQRLSSIMEATRVGTWELDLSRGTLSVCQHWARVLGMGRDALVLSHADFLDMVHPEERAMLESSTPQVNGRSPDMFEHEFRMRHRDGHWIWVLSRGRITRRDDHGQPVGFVGVDIDVSDQKRLEEEIRQSDALLKSALESNVAAFAIYDEDDILLYCNTEAERLIRLKPGLLYGRQMEGPVWKMETLDGQPLSEGDGPCNRARRAGTILRDMRYAIRWSDGRRQILTCNATPFDAGNGRMNTAISFWDITEELEMTDKLKEALANAEAMSRAKTIFLANMSHEIRTPLNGVLGLAEVLSLQIKDPEHSRMIATIRRSGETLLAVLNSILDMSKIEAGKIEIEYVPLRLRDIIQQIETVYAVQAAEKGLDFEVITSDGIDRLRIGDPHRIQQILYNLLNNAIKFSTEGSISLMVSCRPGKPVVFEITDTGVGMTPEQSARVFQSFEQADGTVTRRFGGTGLGLSIVRELVVLMGGEITLDSEAGEGTTVRVSLPLDMADDKPAVEAPALQLRTTEPSKA
ncbi:PAS domain S-box protein [Neotabrizicola sp. VNH66]|uniref:PAS domain S-box protein n=1 Tax=Neotabrizicola sp. VNH66 TaxID=3400918 RepID=UPI003C0CCB2B